MTDPMLGDALRARSWAEFVGQRPLKERLSIHIEAAIADNRMLDHVLLAGPPGFGKTTIAQIIAWEVGDPFASITMPMKPPAFAAFLRTWSGGILLLDEIHRASQAQQEDLLGLLDAGVLRLPNGRQVHVERLTVIGATTEPEKVIAPLYDRFPIKPMFQDYSDEDMGRIVHIMAGKVGLELDGELAVALGRATGGTPRNARQLVFAARDIACAQRPVTLDAILSLCGVERDGLSAQQLQYLRILASLQGQAGLQVLASMLRLHPSTVQELERLLLQRQLIVFGAGGRELTNEGFSRVKAVTPPTRLRRIS